MKKLVSLAAVVVLSAAGLFGCAATASGPSAAAPILPEAPYATEG